jgi:50S ribosomal protein L16 3-hydroxylase
MGGFVLAKDLELRILQEFAADADEVLRPGDMLYLPPGFAHHGVAVTSCLTYSVGFRSPCAGEVWFIIVPTPGARCPSHGK